MPLPVVNGAALLPTSNPVVQVRTGLATQVWLAWFRRTQGSIEELTTSITGTLATILQDTHAVRVAGYNPINYDPGTVFYETDRKAFYVVNPANTAWVYAAGEMSDTFANVPTDLGVNDAGFLLQITDYGHRVKWSGTAWDFAPGDAGSGYFQDFAVAPTVSGWKLCDGTATTYLVMGAVIAATAFTTPNLAANDAYRKSAAAYTGTIDAAVAPGLTGASASTTPTLSGASAATAPAVSGATGSTAPAVSGATGATAPAVSGDTGATAPSIAGNVGANTVTISGATANAGATVSGATANESAHTHGLTATSDGPSTTVEVASGGGVFVGDSLHTHGINTTSAAGSAHSHGAGTLAADAHSHGTGTLAGDSHDHGVGTLAVGSHTHGTGTLAVASHTHGTGTLAVDSHTHGTGTLAVDSHTHGVGTLAVSAHTHGVGTLAVDDTAEPARMGVLVYFRR